jgi:hypothetical protein
VFGGSFGASKQSKEETLQLLLATHFPDSVVIEEMAAFAAADSADEMGGKPVQITVARRSGRGSGARLLHLFLYCLVLLLFVSCTN